MKRARERGDNESESEAATSSSQGSSSTIPQAGDNGGTSTHGGNPLFDGEVFEIININNVTGDVEAKCKLCPETNNVRKGNKSSTGNFIRHVKLCHGTSVKLLEKKLSERKEKKTSTKKSKPKEKDVHPYFKAALQGNDSKSFCLLTQSKVNEAVANFVAEAMVPFSAVENPGFQKLFSTLTQECTIPIYCPGRKAITELMVNRFDGLKNRMKDVFKEQTYLCTTADIWSSRNKSYLGMTVHYLDPKTFERKSLALACRRFKYGHTFDKIAEKIYHVHKSFEIESKTTHTVTDNASNFSKAFREYSAGDTADTGATQSESEINNLSDNDDLENEEEDVEINEISLPCTLTDDEDEVVLLPTQLRCASHTLNLIASTDCQLRKIEDSRYSAVYNSAFGKMRALWTRMSRSTVASDVGDDICKGKFAVPCDTRWNSYFDAAKKVDKERDKLGQVTTALKIPAFKQNDLNFLSEWLLVMEPLATALDILQGEDNCYLGIVLPSVRVLCKKLDGLKGKLSYCEKLRSTIREAVTRRFQPILDPSLESSKDYILATISHPKFKLQGLEKDIREAGKQMFKSECEATYRRIQVSTCSDAEAGSSDNIPTTGVDSFFKDLEDEETGDGEDTPDFQNTLDLEVTRFLSDGRSSLNSLHEYKIIKEVFLKNNTPLPSSGPVERLFSTGGQLLTPRRNRLSDQNFEMLLLTKANFKKLFN